MRCKIKYFKPTATASETAEMFFRVRKNLTDADFVRYMVNDDPVYIKLVQEEYARMVGQNDQTLAG